MARNVEKDIREEKRRRIRILEAGLRLCSIQGIEQAKLQDIADEAEVGIVTLYNYYQNKVNLAIAISAYMWKKVWDENINMVGKEVLDSYDAYHRIEAYFDLIIRIYKEHPEILRFSGMYKTYINMQNIDISKGNEHLDVLAPISDIFHKLYEEAKVDHSIRTDVGEKELFTTLALTMLGMAERYALGLVWASNDANDYEKELLILKDMMLKWLKDK